jgi:hypothetical protein
MSGLPRTPVENIDRVALRNSLRDAASEVRGADPEGVSRPADLPIPSVSTRRAAQSWDLLGERVHRDR